MQMSSVTYEKELSGRRLLLRASAGHMRGTYHEGGIDKMLVGA
jgi:hypothetical protein